MKCLISLNVLLRLAFRALILAAGAVAADTKLYCFAGETCRQGGARDRNILAAINLAAVVTAEVGMGLVQRRIRCGDAVASENKRIEFQPANIGY